MCGVCVNFAELLNSNHVKFMEYFLFFLPHRKDNVKTALPHSPRIIDVQGISNKISIEPAKFSRKRDVKASSPSGDEVININ